jgi:hypothetical protein
MDAKRSAAAAALVLSGSTLGGFLGSAHTQQQPPPNVGVNEVLRVPESGLRMVSNSGRLVGMVALREGNGALVLFDAAGKPSVVVSAGPGGQLEFNGAASGSLKVMDTQRRGVSIVAKSGTAELAVEPGVRIESSEARSRLTLRPKAVARVLELSCEPASAAVAASLGNARLFRLFGEKAGEVRLAAPGGKDGLVASGEGALELLRDGKPVFQAPDGG